MKVIPFLIFFALIILKTAFGQEIQSMHGKNEVDEQSHNRMLPKAEYHEDKKDGENGQKAKEKIFEGRIVFDNEKMEFKIVDLTGKVILP